MKKVLSVILAVSLLCCVAAASANAIQAAASPSAVIAPQAASIPWWQGLPDFIQWILRYLLFGWVWMWPPEVPATTTAPTTTTTTTVSVKVTGVTFTGSSSYTLSMCKTQLLTWAVTPSTATNKGVVFNSSNTAVAMVSPTGLITPKGEGTAIITITTTDPLADQNFTDTVTVTVTAIYATGINISGPASVKTGQTITLTATVLPSNVTTPGVTWSSADPLVATVSAAGVVTGIQPTGDAGVVIRATAKDGSGVYREVSVIVTAA